MALLEVLQEYRNDMCVLKKLIDDFLPKIRKSFVLSWKQRNKLHSQLSLMSTYLLPVCPFSKESHLLDNNEVEEFEEDFADNFVKTKNIIEKFLGLIKEEVYSILKHNSEPSLDQAFKIKLSELDELQRSLIVIHMYLIDVEGKIFKLREE